jgi:hypothetical protein
MKSRTISESAEKHSGSNVPVMLSGDVGGEVLVPGLYETTGSLIIQAGDLTLDARGDEHAVWIFKITSDLTTVGGSGGNVILCGGAKAKNIFWFTDQHASIGERTSFKGNIVSVLSDDDWESRVTSGNGDEISENNYRYPVTFTRVHPARMFTNLESH